MIWKVLILLLTLTSSSLSYSKETNKQLLEALENSDVASGEYSVQLGERSFTFQLERLTSKKSSLVKYNLINPESGVMVGTLREVNGTVSMKLRNSDGTESIVYDLAKGRYKTIKKSEAHNDAIIPHEDFDLRPKRDTLSAQMNIKELEGSYKARVSNTSSTKSFDKTIDVLFVYRSNLIDGNTVTIRGLQDGITIAIDDVNRTFENSGLPYTIRNVGIVEYDVTGYSASRTNEDATAWLYDALKDHNLKRIVYEKHADYVFNVGYEDPEVCGRAFVANQIDEANVYYRASNAWRVGYVDYGCLWGGTLAHELGHNLGLQHDRTTLAEDAIGSGDQYDYHIPYGYVPESHSFYTVMAYSSACTWDIGSCIEYTGFSNPDVTFEGEPTGLSEENINAADAAGALNKVIPYAAYIGESYRPANIYIDRQDDDLIFSWDPVEGAVEYIISNDDWCVIDSETGVYVDDLQTNHQRVSTNGFVLVPPYGQSDFCVYALSQNGETLPVTHYVMNTSRTTISYPLSDSTYYYEDRYDSIYFEQPNVSGLVKSGDTAEVQVTVIDDLFDEDFTLGSMLNERGEYERNHSIPNLDIVPDMFDWNVEGSGSQRTLKITLKQDLELYYTSEDDGRNRRPIELLLFQSGYFNIPELEGTSYHVNVASKILIEYSSQSNNYSSEIFSSDVNETEEAELVVIVYDLVDAQNLSFVQTSGFSAAELESIMETVDIGGLLVTRITATYIAPAVKEDIVMEFALTIDGINLGVIKQVVRKVDMAPEITGSSSLRFYEDEEVLIELEVQDIDGEIAQYRWYQVNESSITLVGEGNPELHLGILPVGEYTYRLDATDDEGLVSEFLVNVKIIDRPEESNSSGGMIAYLLPTLMCLTILRRKLN